MAFHAAIQDSSAPSATINITPLVDVMLVLLIIFMVTMPMVSRPLDANLPQPAEQISTRNPPPLVLQVAASGDYLLDGQHLAPEALSQRLREAHEANPRVAISVSAAASLDYQRMVSALSLIQEAGVRNVAVVQP